MIKKHVFSGVAQGEKLTTQMSLLLGSFLGTDRLESLFGILRMMVGNDANLDILQLSLCITSTTEVSSILAKHPEWDKGLRRLHLPTVSRSFDKTHKLCDHIGPKVHTVS